MSPSVPLVWSVCCFLMILWEESRRRHGASFLGHHMGEASCLSALLALFTGGVDLDHFVKMGSAHE